MKVLVSVCISFIFLANAAMAGEIWGIVLKEGVPQEDKTIQICIDDKQIAQTSTNEDGLFSVYVAHNGPCTIKLYDNSNKSNCLNSLSLVVRQKPTRCDMHLP
jgi:hypothetical protein